MSDDDREVTDDDRYRPDPPDSAPLEDSLGDDELPTPGGDDAPDEGRLRSA